MEMHSYLAGLKISQFILIYESDRVSGPENSGKLMDNDT